MIFNKSRKSDFPPELKFTDGTKLEVISQIKLVGLIISDNLSWHENTLYICRKARTKLWIIRRMKSLSLSHEQIFDVYCKEITSIVEFGVPVWHPGLTKKDSNDIERVQKVAFKIILESCYTDYIAACLFSEGYRRYLALCLTSLVSQLVRFCFSKLILGYF